MLNKVKNIKPQYNNEGENLFGNKTGKLDLKKEVSNLSKIIDMSKKLNEEYNKSRSNYYAY